MVVAVGVAAIQVLGGFVVGNVRMGDGRGGRAGDRDEERSLLPAQVEQPLNLKEVLVSEDKLVRRGCECPGRFSGMRMS